MPKELTRELDLLRAAAAGCLDETVFDRIEPCARGVEWPHVIWLAKRHGMAGVLGEVAPRVESCPPSVREQMAIYQRANAVAGLRVSSEMRALVAALTSPRVVVLGDWALSEWHYPKRILWQHHPRVELVVAREDRDEIERALEQRGYDLRPDPLRLTSAVRSDMVVRDTLARGGPPLDRSHPLWARSVPHLLGGREIRTPALSDWLEALCVRLGRVPGVLRHAFNVAAAVRGMTGEDLECALAARGEDARLRMTNAIRIGHEFLGLPLPGPVAAGLAAGSQPAARERQRPSAGAPRQRIADVQSVDSLGRYASTPPAVVGRMLALAGTTPDDVVFDLGCGDGRLVMAAARDFGARAVGVDADPARIAEARANAAGLETRVTFLEADILDVDVSQATVVCLYLDEAAYPVLADTVIARLRAGTRVVSHNLSFAEWPPVRAEVVASGDHTASFVFVWQVPEA